MWRRRAEQNAASELALARAQIAVLEDELMRLKLATQRESETSRAFSRLRDLPDATPTSEEGDGAWQIFTEALRTRDVLVQVCIELVAAVEEIKADLLEMADSPQSGVVVRLGDDGTLCPQCGEGPFMRLSAHLKVHGNGNGAVHGGAGSSRSSTAEH